MATTASTTKTNNNMTAAILAAISGVFTSVGSIWSSSNAIKAEKLAITKLEAEAEAAADLQDKQILLGALDVKKATLASQEAKDKADANVRGVLIVTVAAIVGLLAYFRFKKPKKG